MRAMSAPLPGPVETKVKATALVGLAIGVVLAALNGFIGDSALLGALPPAVQGIVLALAPPLVTFLTGYYAPHTAR